MNSTSKMYLIITIFFISTSMVCSQSQLEFVHKNNKKLLSYKVGDKIGYTTKRFAIIKSGVLKELNDSTINVSGQSIHIEDIKFIGHRKKGTGLIVIGTAVIAGAALGFFTLSADNSPAEKITGLCIAIPVFTVGQIIGWRNRLFNISKNYRHKKSL